MNEKRFSWSISWLNFVLSVLIVMIHTNFEGKYSEILPGYGLYLNMQKTIAIFADCAVAAFFIISAYLFFRNFEMNIYIRRLRNKFHTLCIPYIMWSIIGLTYKMIVSKEIRSEILGGGGGYNLIKAILYSNGNQPLWFLKTLMVFTVISPIIYIILNLSKYTVFLIPQ